MVPIYLDERAFLVETEATAGTLYYSAILPKRICQREFADCGKKFRIVPPL